MDFGVDNIAKHNRDGCFIYIYISHIIYTILLFK